MTVTINGTTGLAGVDGSAGTPAVQGGDTNTGVFFPAADTVAITTGGSERIRINSGGQVEYIAGTAALPAITTTGDTNTGVFFPAADTVAIGTGGSERMRLTSSGVLTLNSNSANINPTSGYLVITNSGGQSINIVAGANGVYLSNNGTSWNAISDERFKENLIPISDAITKVNSLRAVTGNLISDEDKKSRAFLIAQDVQKILPEAVDKSNPEQLGLAYSDVIPLLVAAIKEQQALITALTARITALETP